jgi:hypothetical protein
VSAREKSALHARLLTWFKQHGVAPAEEAAVALGLPVAVVEAVILDLQDAGLIEQALRH